MSLITDDYGALIQLERGTIGIDAQFDGGDSVCWTGHYKYYSYDGKMLCNLNTNACFEYSYYFRKYGKTFGFVRHPNIGRKSTTYYKSPWAANISQDQLVGIMLYYIKWPELKEALRILVHLACWGFLFAHNTVKNNDHDLKWKWPDFLFLDFYCMFLRCFGVFSWAFWPLLNLLDLWLIMLALWFNKFKKDEHIISFGAKIISCREYKPTLASWIAFKFVNWDKFLKLNYRYWCGFRQQSSMYTLTKERIERITGKKYG